MGGRGRVEGLPGACMTAAGENCTCRPPPPLPLPPEGVVADPPGLLPPPVCVPVDGWYQHRQHGARGVKS